MVVTDGFTGNVALKTGEGALKLISEFLRQVFTSGITAKIAYLLVRPGLDRLREWLDPRRYNGAVMVGLNGVVVKSHGGTDALGLCARGRRRHGHGGASVQRAYPRRSGAPGAGQEPCSGEDQRDDKGVEGFRWSNRARSGAADG